MAGIKEKLGNIFGKKKEAYPDEVPRRIQMREPEPKVEEDMVGQRWKQAKKWREDQALKEPLVKRDQFKKKY